MQAKDTHLALFSFELGVIAYLAQFKLSAGREKEQGNKGQETWQQTDSDRKDQYDAANDLVARDRN